MKIILFLTILFITGCSESNKQPILISKYDKFGKLYFECSETKYAEVDTIYLEREKMRMLSVKPIIFDKVILTDIYHPKIVTTNQMILLAEQLNKECSYFSLGNLLRDY